MWRLVIWQHLQGNLQLLLLTRFCKQRSLFKWKLKTSMTFFETVYMTMAIRAKNKSPKSYPGMMPFSKHWRLKSKLFLEKRSRSWCSDFFCHDFSQLKTTSIWFQSESDQIRLCQAPQGVCVEAVLAEARMDGMPVSTWVARCDSLFPAKKPWTSQLKPAQISVCVEITLNPSNYYMSQEQTRH